MSPDELMVAAAAAGLDGVCITEHNRLWTPRETDELRSRYELAIFRGMEVTTTGGDILVFGLEEEPNGVPTPAALKAKVDAAGAVAIAAHPFRGFLVFGFSALRMNVKDAVDNPTFAQVHGLEVCNGLVTDEENAFAREVADEMGLLKVAGSDAHRPEMVGTCLTVFENPVRDEQELVQALLAGRFTVERR